MSDEDVTTKSQRVVFSGKHANYLKLSPRLKKGGNDCVDLYTTLRT